MTPPRAPPPPPRALRAPLPSIPSPDFLPRGVLLIPRERYVCTVTRQTTMALVIHTPVLANFLRPRIQPTIRCTYAATICPSMTHIVYSSRYIVHALFHTSLYAIGPDESQNTVTQSLTHSPTHSLPFFLPSFFPLVHSLRPLTPRLLHTCFPHPSSMAPTPPLSRSPTYPFTYSHTIPGSLLVIFFGALIYAYDDLQFNATGYVTQNTYSSTNRQILIRRGIHPVVCVLGSMLRRPSIQRHKERSPFISTAPRRNRTHTNAYERKRILNSTETPQHPPTK
jgi:hypothetical protein